MGRELRRVSLDFDWPQEKVWGGYVNPHYVQCPGCEGRGMTMAGRRLSDIVNLLMLSGSDVDKQRSHPYFGAGCFCSSRSSPCGEDMLALTTSLAGRAPSAPGHDVGDNYSAVQKILKAAGMPENWGVCRTCDGNGIPNEYWEIYNDWRPTEPPKGPGYQIWETVTEGSPVSPVFATPEELAKHMAGMSDSNYDTWLKFISGPGWAPSFVATAGRLMSGVEAVVSLD